MNDKLLDIQCLHCCLKQVIDTTALVGMAETERRALMAQALSLLAQGDMTRYNSEMIDDCYRIVTRAIGDEDPYRQVKSYYNQALLSVYDELKRHIEESDDPLGTAVRVSIAGNLIDLAAYGNDFTLETVLEKVRQVDREGLTIDETAALRERLITAKTLLLLGDNCGEIVLDKLLLETIKHLYPQIICTYAVRGKPAVNDVTRTDANEVGMGEVAEVIDNGDGVLSTLLHRVSPTFYMRFFGADVVLSKGMGNVEGLYDCGRKDIWYLLIAKCDVVANLVHTHTGAIVCAKGEVQCPSSGAGLGGGALQKVKFQAFA